MTTELETLNQSVRITIKEGPTLVEDIRNAIKSLSNFIPRYVSNEPYSPETMIAETRAITIIIDADTFRLIREQYLPKLQSHVKQAEAFHKDWKSAFQSGHKAACALEKEDVKAAQDEIERLKDLCAASAFVELEYFIEEIDFEALPDTYKVLVIDNAKLEAKLKADQRLFNVRGCTIGKRGKRPVIRQAD